jgi:uncharacterized protein
VLLDLPDEGISFPSPGTVKVDVEPVNEGFVLTGALDVPVQSSCSRCLTPVVLRVSERFRVVLSRDAGGGEGEDDWVHFTRGEREFDLTPIVRDLVVVALPAKPLCSDRCLGLCPVCGNDRNRASCSCTGTTVDPRWAALMSLRADEKSFEREETNHGIAEEKDKQNQA